MSDVEYKQLHELEIISGEPISMKYNLADAAAVYADTLPAPTSSSTLSGWLYEKVSGSQKFNYYFYLNQVLNPIKISELYNCYAVCTVHTVSDITSIPFFVLYSLPTGVNDGFPGFYHSSFTYSFKTGTNKIFSNDKVLFWCGKRKPKVHPNLRHIKLDVETTNGDALLTETLNYMTFHCNSEVSNDYKLTTHSLGWEIKNVSVNNKLI